ncbi:MAG: YajQ family cyclic di-GMP-binding protein [Omnitrophica WOR_2 bacterium RIFCSPHIGHO2_02_FULL_67_20]|nr:MAG: YajQ family cyclic di-GMP-binding protein [Omnitrophica WOR_2 bacterium RIFCSPHIGHO2_02_FULL_67_20]
MAQDHSFDFVSKVNMQEFRNALQQAQREISTRFDFKGSSAAVVFEDAQSPPLLKVTADNHAQLFSVVDVVHGKLAKRGVPLAALSWKEPEQLPGGSMKRHAALQQGISSDQAREIVKAIKDLGLKVQPRIEGDAVRVSGKQLDDLQAVVQTVTQRSFGIPIQAENYR